MKDKAKVYDGGPAFPRAGTDGKEGWPGDTPQDGMSLRDAVALRLFTEALAPSLTRVSLTGRGHAEAMAEASFRAADAWLAVRGQG